MSMFQYAFMQRALIAAVLVGLTAPTVGTYLVQRRLSLVGDGIGHIALTGVALGFLLGTAPVITAVIVATLGAILVELVMARGRASGDVALALLFYGGIALGVLLISKSPGGSSSTLLAYLFGSLVTVGAADLRVIAVLAVVVLLIGFGLRRQLFAVCQDAEYARVAGLPVLGLHLTLAALTAVTVTLSMRVVGVLLISALMVVPVATVQQLSHSFRATLLGSVALGVGISVLGLMASFQWDAPSGPTIVVLAVVAFIAVAGAVAVRGTWRQRRRLARSVPAEEVSA
jgi:zinc transport system permease protein